MHREHAAARYRLARDDAIVRARPSSSETARATSAACATILRVGGSEGTYASARRLGLVLGWR
jgi:hypothetical protein